MGKAGAGSLTPTHSRECLPDPVPCLMSIPFGVLLFLHSGWQLFLPRCLPLSSDVPSRTSGLTLVLRTGSSGLWPSAGVPSWPAVPVVTQAHWLGAVPTVSLPNPGFLWAEEVPWSLFGGGMKATAVKKLPPGDYGKASSGEGPPDSQKPTYCPGIWALGFLEGARTEKRQCL